MALRLVLFYGSIETSWTDAAYLFINLAVLPVLALYAIWPRGAYRGFLPDARDVMRITALYAILMVAFMYAYFRLIDVDFFPSMHERIFHQELANTTEEVDPQEMKERIQTFFSLRNGTAIALAGYMALCGFYAVVFPAIKRVVPGVVKAEKHRG